MSEKHNPRERLQLFRWGWQRGAGSKVIPDQLKDDPDFQNGYREGRIAFNAAMEIAREKFGAPPPSILRTQASTPARCPSHMPAPEGFELDPSVLQCGLEEGHDGGHTLLIPSGMPWGR